MKGGEGTLDELVRLAAKPIAFLGTAVVFIGLLYLGMQLGNGNRGGGEVRKAVAMIAAGSAAIGFAAIYGFSGF